MSIARRLEDDRFYGKAIKLLAALLLLTVVGFGAYYYTDRYSTTAATVIDREIARTQQMVKNDPSNPATRVALGNLYMRKALNAEAAVQFNEALKLDDANQTALSGLGLALFNGGKLKESAAAFERLLDVTKDNIPLQNSPAIGTVHYYLGRIAATQGDLARAEDELKLALGPKRTDADALVALGDVVTQRGRPQEAVDLYKFAVLLVPDFAEAYQGLARAYDAAGQATEATYANAMGAYLKGDYDGAISRLASVVQARPDFAEAHYGLGMAYGKKKDRDRAVGALTKALELNPRYEPARVAILELGAVPPANAVPANHQAP